MNSYTKTNIIICILVQILFRQFLGIGNRYRFELFRVNLLFDKLSNDISLIFVA